MKTKKMTRVFALIASILALLTVVGMFTGCEKKAEPNTEPLEPNSSIPTIVPATEPTEVPTENPNEMNNSNEDKKPIIYLYPTEETEVEVSLGYPENITCTYPLYHNGWNVIAKPNGDLLDLVTNRKLYALYYECKNTVEFNVTPDGFVVKREDTLDFLEEKLAMLGLNEREANEFIVYWLPVLMEHEYNYIRFATQEEIDDNMPLNISPAPDTVIRVLMVHKGYDNPPAMICKPQEFETPERNGFTVVEWGGTEASNLYRIVPIRMPCCGIGRIGYRLPRLGVGFRNNNKGIISILNSYISP